MDDEENFNRMWAGVEDDLGFNDVSMVRTRPYNGQRHTDTGKRGQTEVNGITFRDLRDCFIRAVCMCSNEYTPELHEEALKGEKAALCENDLYRIPLNNLDIMAVQKQLCCEVERIMGIYPNVPGLNIDPENAK